MPEESANKIRTVSFSLKQGWAIFAGFCTIMGGIIYGIHEIDNFILDFNNNKKVQDERYSEEKIDRRQTNTLVQIILNRATIQYAPIDTFRYIGDQETTYKPIIPDTFTKYFLTSK